MPVGPSNNTRCKKTQRKSHNQVAETACGRRTCHDASQVIPHVAEVQVVLSDGKVSFKGRYLFPQYEQLLDSEQLGIHQTTLLGQLPACSLHCH